ncbi:mucin like 3 [Phyllostomus discolor]|uniref:Mucin like 3 n=1 Tax=Phyllostomus discolor TaxID=89673 RepID=A0A834EFP2_9CHIR|nr:mucin like 3 [Phyllostomus discolor]
MAQPAHCTRSDFGLQYCLLFLLATQGTGASTFQEFQNPGESPTSDNLSPRTPNLIYTTPSDHTALHLGHSPPDNPKSPETHQPKHHCNATHHLRPVYKPIENSKNFTTHHKAAPTSVQNPSNQGKDPVIRNGRSADSNNTRKKLSDATYPTTKPTRKTTCRQTTTSIPTVKTNAFKTSTPLESTIITLDSKSITIPSHHSVKSESSNRLTFSSEKSTTYKASRTTEKKKKVDDHTAPANYNTTVASDKTLIKTREQTKETPRVTEKNKQTPVKPTYHQQKTISVHMNTTRAPAIPTEHKQQRTSAHEKIHTKKTTSTKGKTTPIPAKPTENPTRNTADTETIRSPVKVTGDQSITTSSPYPKRTEVTPQLPIGSFTLSTFSMELSSVMSEAPANKGHPHQNKDSSQGGLHVGEVGKDDSFPPWAIVIVVLVAVILLLVFLGLIFLISHMMQTRRALIDNTENNDPEDDDGGPNSYPVYLMEQQTLGVGQIPSPR